MGLKDFLIGDQRYFAILSAPLSSLKGCVHFILKFLDVYLDIISTKLLSFALSIAFKNSNTNNFSF